MVITSLLASLFVVTACTDSPRDSSPDGVPPPPPLELAGDFAVRSAFVLSTPPPAAADVLAELAAATDGPDDPSRFLIDRLVARLPEGRAQLVAAAVAPYVAAYVQRRIDMFAPELASGLRSLAAGVGRIAHRFGTTETLAIEQGGYARHVITGVRFDTVDLAFAPLGMPDIAFAPHDEAASTAQPGTMHPGVALAGERIELADRAAVLPYGAMLRLGLDQAVLPQVVPGATDLVDAFGRLVACDRLGALVAEYLGIGSPELYAGACAVAMTRLAAEIYERLDVAPAVLAIRGTARAIDLDRDGPIDVIAEGLWSGTLAHAPLASASFDGAAP